jgi:hypothetical protein
MAIGLIGQHGLPVQKLVVVAIMLEVGHALTHSHRMEVYLALEMLQSKDIAMRVRVQ